MFVKRFKKKCSVRGCKNIHNVYIISKRREMGNTIAMCTDCLKEAVKDTENYIEVEKVKAEPRPLFPHPEVKKEVTASSVDDFTEEVENIAPTETITDEVSNTSTLAEDVVISAEKPMPKAPNNPKSAKKKPNKKK